MAYTKQYRILVLANDGMSEGFSRDTYYHRVTSPDYCPGYDTEEDAITAAEDLELPHFTIVPHYQKEWL